MLEALYITLIGMLIVFVALGAVLLVMVGLGKLFSEKGSKEKD
jgi:Na+-transporting methylmalonyl-CoA/oxaloacetate decarboxylase gamma subunit